MGRIAVGLYRPDSGDVVFNGGKRDRQVVFQDPFSSLNPRMRVGDIVTEPIVIHDICNRRERKKRAGELLADVGLDPAFAERYHRSRADKAAHMHCRALSVGPS